MYVMHDLLRSSMQGFTILSIVSYLLSMQHNSYAVKDTMTASQFIKDGQTMISSDGSFQMGFFSPGNSSNRYVGIWYQNITVFTVVWVANRKVPLTNKSGILKLIYPQGILVLDDINTNTTIWSSSSSFSYTLRLAHNPILQLLESGNLVVRDENDHNPENFFWQSFDYPTDTLLPGMKLGKNFKTGLERTLTSWNSIEDPNPGDYTYQLDPTGYPQIILRKGSVENFRLGSWTGLGFSGLPNPTLPFDKHQLVFDQNEVYYRFELNNKLVYSRITLNVKGIVDRWSWVNKSLGWRALISTPADYCDTYSICGAYTTCNVICQCLDKFVPKNQTEWDLNVWSSGCVRRKELDCKNGDGFHKYSNVKLPDTRFSWYNRSLTLKECEAVCLKNCSCMAYTTLDMRRGSGCLLWFGDLIDIKELSSKVQDIYLRVASSDSDPKLGSDVKKGVIIKVGLPIFVGIALLGLSLIMYAWRKKRQQLKNEGMQEEDLELPFFTFSTVANATENFSIENKLGEGGFGEVFKGLLEEGKEIAVKRLSKTSRQGLEEFKNEAICIAKLQHRNLVKLQGYCIQGDEMMLIYEYLSNKSLDSFIFDENQRALLDWPKRFHIINGIARGLLYLHQDSRLRIIHRDLKASNVLLDIDMNPKISDFGLAKSFRGNETGANTKIVAGTYGYMSPEYVSKGIFSVKSDVFSFGVMVMEIISGKRNRCFVHPDNSHNLLGHAWTLYKEDKWMELIDESLTGSCVMSEVLRSIQVGLLCVQKSPEDRPNMSTVVLMLGCYGGLLQPKQPGFFTGTSTEGSSSDHVPVSIIEFTNTMVDGR